MLLSKIKQILILEINKEIAIAKCYCIKKILIKYLKRLINLEFCGQSLFNVGLVAFENDFDIVGFLLLRQFYLECCNSLGIGFGLDGFLIYLQVNSQTFQSKLLTCSSFEEILDF